MLCAVLQTALGCPALFWVQTQHSSQQLQLCVLDHTAQPEAATAPGQHLLGSIMNQHKRQHRMAKGAFVSPLGSVKKGVSICCLVLDCAAKV